MENRSIVKLLQICIDNFDLFKKESDGLCYYFWELRLKNKISYKERILLGVYLKENIPSPFQSFSRFILWSINTFSRKNEKKDSCFFWLKTHCSPRLKWLKSRLEIEKQKQLNN